MPSIYYSVFADWDAVAPTPRYYTTRDDGSVATAFALSGNLVYWYIGQPDESIDSKTDLRLVGAKKAASLSD